MRLDAGGLRGRSAMLWMLCVPMVQAWAAVDHLSPPIFATVATSASSTAAADQRIDFDIPVQPLSAALSRYAALTERASLFRSEMVAGRTSSAVRGRYTAETALTLLLEGTGLGVEWIKTGPAEAFALRAVAPTMLSMHSALSRAGDYPGLLQVRVWEALCASPRTAPGQYRALIRFEVDSGGQVHGVRLLGSTGDVGRDVAMLNALGRVRLDTSPPPSMPQPLTIILLPDEPRSAVVGPKCGDDTAGKVS